MSQHEHSEKTRSGPRVAAAFKDAAAAQAGMQAVEAFGYSTDDVTVIATDKTMQAAFPGRLDDTRNRRAAEGAAYGGALGVATGAAVGILLPGLLAAGPVVAALMAAGTLGASGAILGAWSGLGVPDEISPKYEDVIRDGGIVLTIETRDAEEAAAITEAWSQIR